MHFVTVLHLIRDWTTFLAVTGLAVRTVGEYRRALGAFLLAVEASPEDVTEDMVIDYLASMSERGGAQRMALKSIRSFYGWAVPRDRLPHNPVERLKLKPPKYGPAPSLTRGELDALFSAAGSVDPRARWAIQFCYATGARVESLVNVMPDDVDLDSNKVTFRVAKNSDPYSVPLGSKAQEAAEQLLNLQGYRPRRGNHCGTLIGVGANRFRGWLKEAADKAGIEKRVHPHLLRHTFATRIAESPDSSVRDFIELMNHKDPSQFRRYAQANQKSLREAVEVL